MIKKPAYEELEKKVLELEAVVSGFRDPEKSLSENAEMYDSLFKNNHSVMLIIDPETLNIADANSAAVAFYGWSHEAFIKKKITDINTLSEDEVALKARQAVSNEKNHFFFSHRLEDGTVREVEVYSCPISLNGKEFLYSIIHDITDRKKAEESLTLSRQKLDLHFLQTPLAVIEWDLDFKVRSWNPAAEKIFGYTKEEILGRHASIIVPEKERDHIDKIWSDLLRQKGGNRSTNKNITKKGEILFCEWFNTPIISKAGETIAVFSLAQDATKRIRAEAALRINEERFRGLFENMTSGIIVCNVQNQGNDFIVNDFNREAEKIAGLKREAIIGKNILDVLPDLKGSEVVTAAKKVYRTGKAIQIPEFLYVRKRHIWIEQYIYKLPSDEIVAVFNDITEKKSLQAETMRAGHLASIGELAAGVAHEINNPVTGIMSVAEILAEKADLLEEDGEIPEMIIREAERISKIVQNLLSFARDNKDDSAPVDVRDVLDVCLDLVEKQIEKDGIRLLVNIPPDIPEIIAHGQEIQQVFLNLISNARHALKEKYPTSHEGKLLEIKGAVIEHKNSEYVRLTFFDSGTGVPEHLIDRIIDPFFSTKENGEGTGLGLSISHGIVENHGGRLSFESRFGEYTKVIVDLPAMPDPITEE